MTDPRDRGQVSDERDDERRRQEDESRDTVRLSPAEIAAQLRAAGAAERDIVVEELDDGTS